MHCRIYKRPSAIAYYSLVYQSFLKLETRARKSPFKPLITYTSSKSISSDYINPKDYQHSNDEYTINRKWANARRMRGTAPDDT